MCNPLRLPSVALLLLFCIWAPAHAQEEYERELPSRETEAQEEARKTASEALRRAPFEGEEISYEQILADPDNVELNIRYARAQIARGNLKAAATALERILLIDPSLAQVQLLYGIVLFRLDNTEEAERMLIAVRGMEIPPSLREEVDL
ncbi:MAG: tetratricopeptide repeat protein [Candidatus Omnitrophica bacterium]|nr:tetratricopeptide repeat protein [Candidatus Omnitrophota bacterium]